MSYRVRLLTSDRAKRTPTSSEEALADLNHKLQHLSSLFPHIMPTVFREMLVMWTGESALFVVADQLLKYPDKWVQGRWKGCLQQTGLLQEMSRDHELAVPLEERFRREEYKKAARRALHQEFRSLHKSTIDAVTAENNHSYTRARPVLQGIEAKSWRWSVRNFFTRRERSAKDTLDSHYMLVWSRSMNRCGDTMPNLRETGDFELDQELQEKVLGPLMEREKAKQEKTDLALAIQANEAEARTAEALYECECCYHEATFEQIATCTSSGHVSCFNCLSRAVNEGLYGQSWWNNIDHERGLIRCLAPSSDQACSGCIPPDIAQRALIQCLGLKQWLQFETSLAKEALTKSRIPLIHCPFCSYAEIDDHGLTIRISQYRLNTSHMLEGVLLCILALIILPLLEVSIVSCRIFSQRTPPHIATMISNSLRSLYNSKHRTRRFLCRSPLCALPSCMSCSKVWCDPHICYESTALSLRTAIESARTAALKRTCPQCGVGFIKDSGCNKLTCKCGHIMCYICRQALSRYSGGEAYTHFCQHFRPAGGKCEVCNKCDLYQADDEETLVRRAGETAEMEWRKREGMDEVEGIGGVFDANLKHRQWVEQWTMQGWMDWWVRKLVVC